MSILELKNINLVKDGGETLLENVNLKAEPGDVILITGNNGTGKSTLFKALLSFIGNEEDKYAGIEGEFIFDGVSKKKDLNSYIISIQQEDYLSMPIYKAKTALKIGLEKYKDRKKRFNYWIEKYRPLTEEDKNKKLIEKFIFSLSGGEEKYLSILQGLVRCDDSEIKLVLIDEPTNNLDHSHIKHLSDLIQRIRHFRPELAFIIISHCRVWPYITKTYEIKKPDEKSNNTLIEVDNECHNCFGEADEDGYYNSSMNPSK
jgi:ABC-type multidrug transport system ATPase subunit